eukprot:scaffold11003_cov111-Isochrysis_galbana.AAC.3
MRLRITMPCAAEAGSCGRSACCASIECAACGRASGRRLQLERPAAPAAACTCPAREAASAIARALPSFVCVRSDGGKTKIGERRYANYIISTLSLESSPS